MNNTLIAANFKSYKTISEANEWLSEFSKINSMSVQSKDVVVFPSFNLLFSFYSYFSANNIKAFLGAQNLSPFEEGPYTGEVSAKQVKELASYVLIGHSERRKFFGETDEMLGNKVRMALENKLIPIFCVQDKNTFIPEEVSVIAYEPVFAIGSGNPDTPENADGVAAFLKSKNSGYKVLYGGSVTSQNVKGFTSKTSIDGVLVGGASLQADEFLNIINNA